MTRMTDAEFDEKTREAMQGPCPVCSSKTGEQCRNLISGDVTPRVHPGRMMRNMTLGEKSRLVQRIEGH